MKSRILLSLTALTLSLGWLGQASAAVIFDERLDGDAPILYGQSVNLGIMAIGQSEVIGALPAGDEDLFIFTVAFGAHVDHLVLEQFVGPGANFGFSPRDSFPGNPGIGTDNILSDLLDLVQVPHPLSSGRYVFFVFTGTNVNPFYEIGIFIGEGEAPPPSIPEPSTLALASLAGLALLGFGRLWSKAR